MSEIKSILVAASSRVVAKFILNTLSQITEDITIFTDGNQAADFISGSPPSIAVIDARLPGKDGFEICNKNNEKFPIILFSNNGDLRDKALERGAMSFLTLPYNNEELITTVKRLTSKKKTILLVDDSKLIHQVVGGRIIKEDFNLIEAYDGKEGLKKTVTEMPDLIISDIEMPVMNGYEFCKKVKETKDETTMTTRSLREIESLFISLQIPPLEHSGMRKPRLPKIILKSRPHYYDAAIL